MLCQLVKNAHCKKSQAESIETCCQLLRQTQLLDPSPAILREYSKSSVAKSSVANSSVANSSVANSSVANSSVATRLGERGENSAALVKSILSDDTTAAAYTSWLKELTPAELDEIGILQGAVGDSLFAVRKKGESFPAPILSDGTLRFAAIAAAFFQPEPPHTLMIEEIENGLHPTRLRLLLELLKSQSARGKPQVMATSHSPQVPAWLTKDDFNTTFLYRKDEDTGASTISPLSEVPGFLDLAREQPAADLFAEGWLEGAV